MTDRGRPISSKALDPVITHQVKTLLGTPKHAWKFLGLDPTDLAGRPDVVESPTGEALDEPIKRRLPYHTFYRAWGGQAIQEQECDIIEDAWRAARLSILKEPSRVDFSPQTWEDAA